MKCETVKNYYDGAFQKWSNTPIKERGQVLSRYHCLLEKMAKLMSEESGVGVNGGILVKNQVSVVAFDNPAQVRWTPKG